MLVLRAASAEGVEIPAFRRSGWTQLGSVAAEHKIALVDAVGVVGCTVDNLTINPRASPLRWSRFCINMRSQWEWHQRSLCMLVILTFGCYLAMINFRGDCGESAISGQSSSSEGGIVEQVRLPISH